MSARILIIDDADHLREVLKMTLEFSDYEVAVATNGREALELAQTSRFDLIFCDTDMITIRIWSEEVFGRSAPELIALSEQRHYDHWLLCRPDIPWEPDPLRENPHDRDRLFAVYEVMLKKLGKPYTLVQGEQEQRMATAIKVVDLVLNC